MTRTPTATLPLLAALLMACGAPEAGTATKSQAADALRFADCRLTAEDAYLLNTAHAASETARLYRDSAMTCAATWPLIQQVLKLQALPRGCKGARDAVLDSHRRACTENPPLVPFP